MNAMQGSISRGALPMGLSSAARKWMGEVTKVATWSPKGLTQPRRFQSSEIQSRQSDYSTMGLPTMQRSGGSQFQRAFADYTFYKGKGAMCMRPRKPAFKPLDHGDAALDREGSLFLEFAPALGPRQYDWSRKQIIALSVLEIGTLVGLTMGEGCEFFHDPFMGKSDAGKVRKVLKVDSMSDHSGFFFNFYVSNNTDGSEARITIPITKAEYSVLRSSCHFLIPYLMGWHMVVDPSKVEDCLSDGNESNALSPSEWDK